MQQYHANKLAEIQHMPKWADLRQKLSVTPISTDRSKLSNKSDHGTLVTAHFCMGTTV